MAVVLDLVNLEPDGGSGREVHRRCETQHATWDLISKTLSDRRRLRVQIVYVFRVKYTRPSVGMNCGEQRCSAENCPSRSLPASSISPNAY